MAQRMGRHPDRPERVRARVDSGGRGRALHIAGWAALGVVLIGAGVALLPLDPMFLSFSIDGSFGATLHHEAATRHGGERTLISTYGPLGFVYYSLYLPATFRWLVALQAVLGVAICWALAWIGWVSWRSPWGAAVAVGAVAPFLGAPDVRFWILPLLAVLVELPRHRAAPASLRLVLGAALGLIGLVKITFLTAAVVAIAPLALADLVRRRVPLMAVSAVLTTAVAWLVQGLGWADWLAYLDWSYREVTPGYSAAMQVPSTPALVVQAVAVCIAAAAAGTLLARERAPARWWAVAPALAGLLFLLFKAGFVRADVHVFITAFGLVVYGVLLAIVWGTAPRRAAVAVLLVATLPGALLWHAIALRGAPTSVLFRVVAPGEMFSRLRALPGLLFSDALAQAHAEHAAAMRAKVALPADRMPGPMDVHSYQQTLLLAYGVDFRPRPVFQSYMAYTPRLAAANAAFLSGDRAPRWIVFEPATIDRRFPALDDAAAWPLLLTRYQLAGARGQFVLLQRRETALDWHLAPLGRVTTSTDARIDVPSGAVWARIVVHESFADRLVATLFAGPYVFMDVTFADGQPWRYRLVPAIAREGFLLSPLIGTAQDMVMVLQQGTGAIPARAIQSFRVQVESPFEQPWGSRPVEVEFFQFVIGEPGPK